MLLNIVVLLNIEVLNIEVLLNSALNNVLKISVAFPRMFPTLTIKIAEC